MLPEQRECHTKYHRQCANKRNATAKIASECGYAGLRSSASEYATRDVAFFSQSYYTLQPFRSGAAFALLTLPLRLRAARRLSIASKKPGRLTGNPPKSHSNVI